MATLKLGALVVRTLAKPVANSLKKQTKNSDTFKKFCIGLAQKSHSIEMKLKMNFLGYEKERIRPLSNSRAVDIGAEFLGEAMIFSVAAGIIGYEAYRTSRKNQERRDLVDEAIEDFKIHYDDYQLERKENMKVLAEFEQKVSQLNKINETNIKIIKALTKKLPETEIKELDPLVEELNVYLQPPSPKSQELEIKELKNIPEEVHIA